MPFRASSRSRRTGPPSLPGSGGTPRRSSTSAGCSPPWRFVLLCWRTLFDGRPVEAVLHHGVARRVLVDVRRPVPYPLAGDEDRHDVVELELHHLERRRVPVAGQVADQPAVLVDLLRPLAVADPRGLHDREIGGLPDRRESRHHVEERDQAVLVDLHLPATSPPMTS